MYINTLSRSKLVEKIFFFLLPNNNIEYGKILFFLTNNLDERMPSKNVKMLVFNNNNNNNNRKKERYLLIFIDRERVYWLSYNFGQEKIGEKILSVCSSPGKLFEKNPTTSLSRIYPLAQDHTATEPLLLRLRWIVLKRRRRALQHTVTTTPEY